MAPVVRRTTRTGNPRPTSGAERAQKPAPDSDAIVSAKLVADNRLQPIPDHGGRAHLDLLTPPEHACHNAIGVYCG
jgi:hypothetical protein